MSGYCENCLKEDTCKKTIGIMFGFCNTDYRPKREESQAKQMLQAFQSAWLTIHSPVETQDE